MVGAILTLIKGSYMIKLIFELLHKMSDKVLSARFIITVTIGITYCHIVNHCVHHYLTALTNNPGQLEAFVTGLMVGFTSIATFVIKAYFDRSDRADEKKSIPSTIEPAKAIVEPITLKPTPEV